MRRPLANLHPATTPFPPYGIAIIVGALVVVFLLLCICRLISREEQGRPIFTSLDKVRE